MAVNYEDKMFIKLTIVCLVWPPVAGAVKSANENNFHCCIFFERKSAVIYPLKANFEISF
jgi:hypothetical protein